MTSKTNFNLKTPVFLFRHFIFGSILSLFAIFVLILFSIPHFTIPTRGSSLRDYSERVI